MQIFRGNIIWTKVDGKGLKFTEKVKNREHPKNHFDNVLNFVVLGSNNTK